MDDKTIVDLSSPVIPYSQQFVTFKGDNDEVVDIDVKHFVDIWRRISAPNSSNKIFMIKVLRAVRLDGRVISLQLAKNIVEWIGNRELLQ